MHVALFWNEYIYLNFHLGLQIRDMHEMQHKTEY